MSEYGSGLTMASAFMLDKERIKMALQGKLVVGEDENGFIYDDAPKEECEKLILQKFDNAVYQARTLAASGRVVDTIMKNHNFSYPFGEYLTEMNKETKKDFESKDYTYEDIIG